MAAAAVAGAAALTAAALAGSLDPGFALAGSVRQVPHGWQAVTYRGVSLAVPATWRVVDLGAHPAACPRLDVHAVYLGAPGPHPRCPASGVGAKTEAVQIAPAVPGSPEVLTATKPVRIGGTAARTNPQPARSHTITDVFSTAGMAVDLSYGTRPALMRRVQATIRVSAQAGRPRAALAMPITALPAAKAQGNVRGRGFDPCAAPSAGVMRAWLRSPYRSVGVYIGGADRACAQSHLTAWWISRVERLGWHVFPMYVGPQAPCVNAPGNLTFSAGSAAAQGNSTAADAAVQAASLRLPHGTPVIYDMEAYSGCGRTVLRFLRHWDKTLHAKGYSAGVYESFSNVTDLIRARTWMKEPDVMDYADWDGQATTRSYYMPAKLWAHHRRIHQYTGGINVTYGGITLNIDKDALDVNLGGGSDPKPPPPPLQNRPETAVVDGKGTVRVYNRGHGGPLWEDRYPASAAWSWQNLNGQWRSDPAAVLGADGAVRLYAVGTNGHMYSKYLLRGRKTWSSWWSMGGRWPWSAAAVVTPDALTRVFAVDPNGRLNVSLRHTNGFWTAWRSLGGGNLRGTPAAIVDQQGGIRVYVRGKGRALKEAHLPPRGRWAWTNMNGSWSADPAAVTGPDGTVRVYATGTNRRLFEDYLPAGGTWSGWHSRGGTTLAGAPAAVADHSGTVRVFVRGSGGTLHEAALAPGKAWTWDSLGGPWPATDPAAVVGRDGTVRVYMDGSRGRSWERRLPEGGSWTKHWWWMGGH